MKWILNASEIETVNFIIRKWLLLLHDTHCLENELSVCLCLENGASSFVFSCICRDLYSVYIYSMCVNECVWPAKVSRAIQSSSVGLIGVILAW